MKKLVLLLLALLTPSIVFAGSVQLGTVREASPATLGDVAGMQELSQEVTLELPDGSRVETDFFDIDRGAGLTPLVSGDRVVVREQDGSLEIGERYRLAGLAWVAIIFVVIAVLVAGWRVWRSIAALALALGILVTVFAPLLLAGYPPLFVAGFVGTLIAAVTFFIGHGFRHSSLLGLIATITTLLFAMLLARVAVELTALSGTASEEALFLTLGTAGAVDMHGLLLAGMLVGALGVLDDVTMAQIETVAALRAVNTNIRASELFSRAMVIGRTHIASVINTLALAYAGASLPLFLLFQLLPDPIWVTLNSEFIMEELVRMLVGSSAIVLAIPIATGLAVLFSHGGKENSHA